ncbi:MAG: hypothetical protein K2X66_07140 [Cyanobacteria bacterium]|nr:hypothetical protein [Cyanobacteriota bacterium]
MRLFQHHPKKKEIRIILGLFIILLPIQLWAMFTFPIEKNLTCSRSTQTCQITEGYFSPKIESKSYPLSVLQKAEAQQHKTKHKNKETISYQTVIHFVKNQYPPYPLFDVNKETSEKETQKINLFLAPPLKQLKQQDTLTLKSEMENARLFLSIYLFFLMILPFLLIGKFNQLSRMQGK